MPRATSRARTTRRGMPLSDQQRKQTLTLVKQTIGRRTEKKHHDVSASSVDVISTGNLARLSAPAQGITDTTRTGDELNVSKFRIRFRVQPAATSEMLRFIVFRWKLDDAETTPTLAHLLENGTNILSDYNWDDMNRNAKILKDMTFQIPGTSAVQDTSFRTVTISLVGKNLGKRNIKFDNTGLDGFDHIYAYWISTKATSAGPTVSYYSRMEFYDS